MQTINMGQEAGMMKIQITIQETSDRVEILLKKLQKMIGVATVKIYEQIN
jgi:acetolactate synthase regulatory subunit